jgi:hypothetical protein
MANYKINTESVEAYEMDYLIKMGLADLKNVGGDAAFRVWCRIITDKYDLDESYPHMSKKSVENGIKALLEEKWIVIDENKTIHIILRETIKARKTLDKVGKSITSNFY